ncbi:unnamed protein product [Blepharisma stoltei]|uniref:C2H2-type domain-containing protein n=1 Tax=Blepharisma stoltei TaxID=1481888 RepID=A0AAU9K8P7_9CILI|nr:unnamed protein product [Blepharisma stoltei]
MSSLNEIRPFVCSICQAKFKNKQFLQRHMISHTSLRSFICDICGKTYKYKKGLNRHIQKVHTEMWESMKQQHPRKRCNTFDVGHFLSLEEDSSYKIDEALENQVFKEVSVNENVNIEDATCRVIFTSPFPA